MKHRKFKLVILIWNRENKNEEMHINRYRKENVSDNYVFNCSLQESSNVKGRIMILIK